MYFVYIIETKDETYYTGMINDLARRMNEHESGSSENYLFARAFLRTLTTASKNRTGPMRFKAR